MFRFLSLLILSFFLVSCSDTENNFNAPIPIKVVVVTMFDRGVDGEFYRWLDRRRLDTVFEDPNMNHDIHVNLDTGVMALLQGWGLLIRPHQLWHWVWIQDLI